MQHQQEAMAKQAARQRRRRSRSAAGLACWLSRSWRMSWTCVRRAWRRCCRTWRPRRRPACACCPPRRCRSGCRSTPPHPRRWRSSTRWCRWAGWGWTAHRAMRGREGRRTWGCCHALHAASPVLCLLCASLLCLTPRAIFLGPPPPLHSTCWRPAPTPATASTRRQPPSWRRLPSRPPAWCCRSCGGWQRGG